MHRSTTCSWRPCGAMAGEAECVDVVVGDGDLLHGELAADGERDAANAVDQVKCAYDTGVVTRPRCRTRVRMRGR